MEQQCIYNIKIIYSIPISLKNLKKHKDKIIYFTNKQARNISCNFSVNAKYFNSSSTPIT